MRRNSIVGDLTNLAEENDAETISMRKVNPDKTAGKTEKKETEVEPPAPPIVSASVVAAMPSVEPPERDRSQTASVQEEPTPLYASWSKPWKELALSALAYLLLPVAFGWALGRVWPHLPVFLVWLTAICGCAALVVLYVSLRGRSIIRLLEKQLDVIVVSVTGLPINGAEVHYVVRGGVKVHKAVLTVRDGRAWLLDGGGVRIIA